MRILVTAGPTCEPIDTVRFLTNASSGRMGCAVAAAGAEAGHDVTLLLGPCGAEPPAGVRVERFVTVDDLKAVLDEHFDACDALVMAAAVGDFRPDRVCPTKLCRRGGPVTLRLIPTEDLLVRLRPRRRAEQVVVAFALEDGDEEATETSARAEMAAKGADLTVLNTPPAMDADVSRACILTRDGVALAWAERSKEALAAEVVDRLERAASEAGAAEAGGSQPG